MLCRCFTGSALLAAISAFLLSASAGAAEPAHRALRAALYHMKEAKEEIRDDRFKRHRERIEKDLRVATTEIERAFKEGKIEARYEPPKGWDSKYKSFKHLRQAMVELDEAKREIRDERAPWARRAELGRAIDDARAHIGDALKEIK